MTRVTFFSRGTRHAVAEIAYLPVGKREQTKVQNRQAILDAAREVFGELGYEAATVRDIIRRTGLAARRFGPILKAIRARSGADFEAFVRDAIAAYFEFLAAEHRNWLAQRPAGEP